MDLIGVLGTLLVVWNLRVWILPISALVGWFVKDAGQNFFQRAGLAQAALTAALLALLLGGVPGAARVGAG